MFAAILILLFADGLLLAWLLIRQEQNQTTIIMNQAEALAELQAIKTQTTKVFTEVSAKLTELTGTITALQDQIANGALPEEIASVIAGIKTGLQQADDLIPDTTPA